MCGALKQQGIVYAFFHRAQASILKKSSRVEFHAFLLHRACIRPVSVGRIAVVGTCAVLFQCRLRVCADSLRHLPLTDAAHLRVLACATRPCGCCRHSFLSLSIGSHPIGCCIF